MNVGHIDSSGWRLGKWDGASFRVELAWAHPASGKQDREKPCLYILSETGPYHMISWPGTVHTVGLAFLK